MSQQCEKYMILNGELCTEQASSIPFVYQNIHSLGYSCRHIAQHIELLNQSAKKLFDTELDIKAIFSNYHLVKELVSPAFDAHSLDAYRPQLIYKLIVNKSITL